jgi:peroxiredoxin
MTMLRRAAFFLLACSALVLLVAAPSAPTLAGKKSDEARAILDRCEAFYAGLQSFRATMVVEMFLPQGMPAMIANAPERYELALARPLSLSVRSAGDQPGSSFIQNDEQAYGEVPMFKRYVLTEPIPFEQMIGAGGAEALAVPGSEVLLGLAAGGGAGGKSIFAGKAKRLGEATVDGVDCHHLSLVGPDGRAELWIAKGEQPWLVRRRTEAPEMPPIKAESDSGGMVMSFMPGFDIRFSGWEADPDLAGDFTIEPGEGFTRADTLYPPPEEMGAIFGGPGGPGGPGAGHSSIGKPAPEVTLQAEDAEPVALSSLKGKIVVLDFWATWCKPCVIELPLVDRVTDERADRGVVFYAVNTGESARVVKKFLRKSDLDLPLVLDGDGHIASLYGVGALPHLVVIDAEGVVRHVHLGSGPGSEKRLAAELDALLGS